MSARRPSRIALALFDLWIPDNDSLKGDLLEQFHAGASQWWLWRQVLYALIARPGQQPLLLLNAQMIVLGAAMLVLMAFEAAFATNVIYRLLFGPPAQDITGYFYLFSTPPEHVAAASEPGAPWRFAVAVAVILSAIPTGWFLARLHERHRVLSLAAFSISITACAVVTLSLPFALQFLTTMGFIVGLLAASSIEVATDANRERA